MHGVTHRSLIRVAPQQQHRLARLRLPSQGVVTTFNAISEATANLPCAPGHSISAISRALTSAALASKSEIVAGTLQVVKQPCRQWFPLPASGAIRLTMAHAGSGNVPDLPVAETRQEVPSTSLVGRQCETAQSTGDPDDPSARSPGQSSCLPPVIGVSGSSPRDHAISSNRPRCPAAIPCKGNFARDT